MNGVLLLGVGIGVASIWGAAYLLALWHEDRNEYLVRTPPAIPNWPLSRVLAYLAIAGTLASNFLSAVSLLRLLEVPDFRTIQLALSPFTLAALLTLDVLFTFLALYLRIVRARSGRRAL